MCRELHRVMGQEGPSHTTLFRYAIGKVRRRNVLTERYVKEAIDKVTAELMKQKGSDNGARKEPVEKELRPSEIHFRKLIENARVLIYRYRRLHQAVIISTQWSGTFSATPPRSSIPIPSWF